jgi:hypothetical protein
MRRFAIISEGITDQAVIENILIGYFAQEEEEPTFKRVGLGDDRASAKGSTPPGGWEWVLRALEQGKHVAPLATNDYLVIHIDTDRCDAPGFDVSRREGEKVLDAAELVARVCAKLEGLMGKEFCQEYGSKLVFAIAVDEVECWLLPLLVEKNKRGKITGCLKAANHALKLGKEKSLSPGDQKSLRRYDEVSAPYRKHARLLSCSPENPSLAIFVDRLREIPVDIAPEE